MGWWIPTSPELLAASEAAILRCVRTPYTCTHVPVQMPKGPGDCDDAETCHIRTISVKDSRASATSIPLVMIHGFAAGLGLWVLNYDTLARHNQVHAIDLLGFARSTRYHFSRNADECVDQFVTSIEEWRKEMQLEKFVLMGHSFGAYLSFFYAAKHPSRVQHLILADPWGVVPHQEEFMTRRYPWYFHAIRSVVSLFNPLAALRAAGPYARGMLGKLRADIIAKFESVYEDDTVGDYIFHCNAQTPPTGEAAFSSVSQPLGWAANPLLTNADRLDQSVPLTVMYGKYTWMNKEAGHAMVNKYVHQGRNAECITIPSSGHHIYSDNYPVFNAAVQRILQIYK